MPTVRFLRDFQGRITAERFYTAGTELAVTDSLAEALLAEGGVVEVVAPEVPAAPTVEAGAAAPLPAAPAVKPARKRAARKVANAG